MEHHGERCGVRDTSRKTLVGWAAWFDNEHEAHTPQCQTRITTMVWSGIYALAGYADDRRSLRSSTLLCRM